MRSSLPWVLLVLGITASACRTAETKIVTTDPRAIVECALDRGASVSWDPLAGTVGEVVGTEQFVDDEGAPLDPANISDADVAIYRDCMEENGVDFVDQEQVENDNAHIPPFVECLQSRGYEIEVIAPYRLTGQRGMTSIQGQQPPDVVDADGRACADQVGWDIEIGDEIDIDAHG